MERLFYFLGTLLAKCVQDGRLIDIPLSQPFLKLVCMGELGHCVPAGGHGNLTASSCVFGEVGRSHEMDVLMCEPWLPADDDGTCELIASIQEIKKELKLDPSCARLVSVEVMLC